MTDYILRAQKRELTGKKVKQLRTQGLIPAVIYGHDTKNENISLNLINFKRIYKEAGTSNLVDLNVDDEKSIKVLLKEPDFDALSNQPYHVDIYKVRMSEKLTTEIPLSFVDESPAVVELEGSLVTNRDNLEVECLPGDLVSEFEVDLSTLKTFDDVIKVSDIKIPSAIEVKVDADEVVAQVMPPRSEEEMAELDEAIEEKVNEVEVTGQKPEEGEEAAESKVTESAKPESDSKSEPSDKSSDSEAKSE